MSRTVPENAGENIQEKDDALSELLLPFMQDKNGADRSVRVEVSVPTEQKTPDLSKKAASPVRESVSSRNIEEIRPQIGSIDPLKALRNSVMQTVREGQLEAEDAKTENPAGQGVQTFETELSQKDEPGTPSPEKHPRHEKKRKKTSSLLAKCMPYIYDDHTGSYAEEKPDYTLESVEDIIESAEKRADEKIARMYNLKPADIKRIGSDGQIIEEKPAALPETGPDMPERRPRLRLEETSIKKPLKIGDSAFTGNKMFDTVSIPKVSTTLFDDFSARRTDVEGSENITTPYSESGGMSDSDSTRILPDIKPDVPQVFEDILSHTRPVGTVDISSSSKKPAASPRLSHTFSDEVMEIEVNEFSGRQDVSRVGGELKLELFSSRIRLVITFILSAAAAALHLPGVGDSMDTAVSGIIGLVIFGLCMLVNFNVFAGFSHAFTKKSKITLPLALAGVGMSVYYLFSLISGSYSFEPALLPVFSFLVYDYCAYRKANAVFNNFRIVGSKYPKKAVTLIDDAATTSAMARTAVKGEILAAAETETDELDGFLRNTLSDRPLASRMGVFCIVSLIVSAVIGAAVGVSLGSFTDGLLAAATVLCLAAAPGLFIADMLPFAGVSDKLHRLRAGICSKYSAERIDQINALCIDSADIFPAGCIKLFNMKPLSANNLDETLTMAAAVAVAAGSPLAPLFKNILTEDTVLPDADSVKYEDSLGISGWVGDSHIMIGNRSHMEAHGIRVASLEVDRKILTKGYFPVYLACDQRACALLIIRYETDDDIERELGRLIDRGFTVLVNNCDPNITEQMLCDYYSLYPDSVKILDHIGGEKYRDATACREKTFAHGFSRGGLKSFLYLLTGCHRLRLLTGILTVTHIIASVVMWLLFAGLTFGGSAVTGALVCVLCELAAAVIALTAYFVGK